VITINKNKLIFCSIEHNDKRFHPVYYRTNWKKTHTHTHTQTTTTDQDWLTGDVCSSCNRQYENTV